MPEQHTLDDALSEIPRLWKRRVEEVYCRVRHGRALLRREEARARPSGRAVNCRHRLG